MKEFGVQEGVVYLDSAATSLTPKVVLDAMNSYYEEFNANVHRSVHKMGERATKVFEETREKVADFINAKKDEIVFTKSTTESLNLLAYSLTKDFKKGDNIVLTEAEHHSNLVPWQQLSKERGFEVRYVPLKDQDLHIADFKDLIDDKTRVVSLSHVSNVLGKVNPVKEIRKLTKAFLVVDAAQSVPHMKVDVKDLGCDFLVFSGHKMLGPTGIGVLFGKKRHLENLSPFMYGGEMIKEVTLKDSTFNEVPWKFEAGTPNIAGVIGLGAAIDFLEEFGMDEIEKHSRKLTKDTVKILKEFGAEVYGKPELGIVSFNIPNVHPHDACSILDEEGIALRGGHNCAMPLHEKLGIKASCRASFHVYNSEEDIEALARGLRKVQEVLG